MANPELSRLQDTFAHQFYTPALEKAEKAVLKRECVSRREFLRTAIALGMITVGAKVVKEGMVDHALEPIYNHSNKLVHGEFQNQNELESTARGIGLIAHVGIGTLLGGIGGILIREGKDDLRELAYVANVLPRAVYNLHSEWLENPPSKEELEAFIVKLYYLPPIGGKLNDFSKEKPLPIPPSLTAEEHIQRLHEFRIERNVADPGDNYIHQFTVQGQLPDKFKHVAVALICSSPYLQDWDDYFYEVPWGQVAPLIHDGGVTDTLLNPFWETPGRTDFILRVGKVWDDGLEALERLPIPEVLALPSERLAIARAEQHERFRLQTEARAYQRLSLALHCKENTAAPNIPRELKAKLAHRWDEFTQSIRNLLIAYDGTRYNNLVSVLDVPWFTKTPWTSEKWPGERFEAPWETIKPHLIRLDEKRERHPEMVGHAFQILQSFANTIDQDIGLR